MTPNRRPARILAMQALTQWDVQQDESPAALEAFLEHEPEGGAAHYAGELVRGFWASGEEVDRLISSAAERWTLPRISSVDRNIIRVAVVEMLQGLVPWKVTIDEAIEIGKEYGGADSPRFINGVLDKVLSVLPSRD